MGNNFIDSDSQPTVVTLGPDTEIVDVASFEEAFGEFSELRGRGRARRAARKAARQEKRMTRIQNRVDRKTARKVGRQQSKAAKMQAKQERKTSKMQLRQDRKTMRTQNRMARKVMRNPEEETNAPSDEFETAASDTSMEDLQAQSSPRTNPYISDDQSEETSSPQWQSSYDEESYDPQAGYDEEQGGNYSEDSGEEGYEDESDYNEAGDESEFSGEEAGSSFNNEATGKVIGRHNIHPGVMDVAKKIEWNKYKIHLLEKKLQSGKGNPAEIQVQIDERKRRLSQLENIMQSHSNARGGGRKARAEARVARKAARHELKQARKSARIEKRLARKQKTTPVNAELQPEISHNQIVVPAEEVGHEFSGTGLKAIDERKDYDAPELRVVEIKSSFDAGSALKKIDGKKALIGVGIAAALLYVAHKAKLI